MRWRASSAPRFVQSIGSSDGEEMARRRTHRRSPLPDQEPRPDHIVPYSSDDDLVVADFTSGGAPYGLTVREWRHAQERGEHSAGWARAKRALDAAFRSAGVPDADVEVGWVSSIGRGLERDAYTAAVELRPDPDALSGGWVVLVPRGPASGEQDRRDPVVEARLLNWLGARPLPFRVPRALTAPEGSRRLLVREFLTGIPLDPRAGRQPGVRPWEVTGQLAAAVHTLAPPDWLPGFVTRRAHAVEALSCLRDTTDPVCVDALAWASENLPDDTLPAVLLHGDLLGQNILLDPREPDALIDWEYALRGDPAFDLAIVTRGVRRPFQETGGLSRLLDAYADHGGQEVRAAHVHVHEIALFGRWYQESLLGQTSRRPEDYLKDLRALLKRAMGKG